MVPSDNNPATHTVPVLERLTHAQNLRLDFLASCAEDASAVTEYKRQLEVLGYQLAVLNAATSGSASHPAQIKELFECARKRVPAGDSAPAKIQRLLDVLALALKLDQDATPQPDEPVPSFDECDGHPVGWSMYRVASIGDEIIANYLLGKAEANRYVENVIVEQKRQLRANAKLVEWVQPFDFASKGNTWSGVRRITFELFATRVLIRVHGLITQAITETRSTLGDGSSNWQDSVGADLKFKLLNIVQDIDKALNDICRNLCDSPPCDNAVLVAFLDDLAAIPGGKTRWLTIYWAMCAIAHHSGAEDGGLWNGAVRILNLASTAEHLSPSNLRLFMRDGTLKERMKPILTGVTKSSSAIDQALQGIENLFPISTALQLPS